VEWGEEWGVGGGEREEVEEGEEERESGFRGMGKEAAVVRIIW
jgi:hypothetical protein